MSIAHNNYSLGNDQVYCWFPYRLTKVKVKHFYFTTVIVSILPPAKLLPTYTILPPAKLVPTYTILPPAKLVPTYTAR